MKTIQVKFRAPEIFPPDYGYTSQRKYSFLIDGDIKEGDIIKTADYSDNMEVVKIFNEGVFPYFDKDKQRLSSTRTENSIKLKTIKLIKPEENVILGIKKDD